MACSLSGSTRRMSRQMLSASSGSLSRRYRRAFSKAAGTEAEAIDFSLGIFPSGCCGWRRRRTAARADDLQKFDDRVVISVHNSFFERNDRVVRDLDALRTNLCAALGDIAVSRAQLAFEKRQSVAGVQRVHLQAGDTNQKPRPAEFVLTIMVPQD